MRFATPLVLSSLLLFPASGQLPEISFENLQLATQGSQGDADDLIESIKDAGGKVGVFAVTDLGIDLEEAHEVFMDQVPGCLLSGEELRLPTLRMVDGSSRTTYATESGEFPECLTTIHRLSATYDLVEGLVSDLIQKMCGGRPLRYRTSSSAKDLLLSDSPVKDHVHVYHSNNNASGDDVLTMVPNHVDNGIFLILSPFPNHGLTVRLSDGQQVSTSEDVKIRPGSLLVLVGRGLTDWLLQYQKGRGGACGKLFHPVPHSVPAMAGRGTSYRSVYARMKVAQDDAVPLTNAVGWQKTFRDVFTDTGGAERSDSDTLCPVQSRRWVRSASRSCEEENAAYCWMSCMPLPSACPDETNAICRSDNKAIICTGGRHSAQCKWHCRDDDDAN